MNRDRTEITLKKIEKLFDEFYPSLCWFANKYLNDFENSKDVVQEVFVKLWENKISYTTDQEIKSFLYVSVKNKSLNYLNSKRHRVTDNYPVTDMEELKSDDFLYGELLIIDTSALLKKAIEALPEKCREVISFSIQDYTNKEIAGELKISLNTVKTQKQIAYKKLRAAMSLLNSFFIFF